MSFRTALLPAFAAALFLGACDNGTEAPSDPKTALVAHSWRAGDHTVSPGIRGNGKLITDFREAVGECFPSPEYDFQPSGRYAASAGTNACGDFGTAWNDTGKWSLSADGKSIILDSDNNSLDETWTLEAYSGDSFRVSFPMWGTVGDNPQQTERIVFRPR